MTACPPKPVFATLCGLFVGFGLGHAFVSAPLPAIYVRILTFFALKVLFDYHKCTVSYIECKARGVPRERGYINALLEGVMAVRNDWPTFVLLVGATSVVAAHVLTTGGSATN